MKKLLIIPGIIAAVCLLRCANPSADKNSEFQLPAYLTFPGSSVTGMNFPVPSAVIEGWLTAEDTNAIYQHGWALWAGLTDTLGSDSEYVFEKWFSPLDLTRIMTAGASNAAIAKSRKRDALEVPRQFGHASQFVLAQKNAANAALQKPVSSCDTMAPVTAGTYATAVTVDYNLPAAKHILRYSLYNTDSLNKIYSTPSDTIPGFPSAAIAIKPTYELIPPSAIVNGYFPLRIWTTPNLCQAGFPNTQWPGIIYVDVNNKSNGTGAIGTVVNGKVPPQSAAITYNLRDFIHYTVQADDVANLDTGNNNGPGQPVKTIAQVNDIALLVGMHVTTKEIFRWTWETFWWTPAPQTPPYPSSPDIYAQMPPKYVKGPAAHYAMGIAYTYLWPNQPNTGGTDSGSAPIYAFNPFLESGFGFFGTPGIVKTRDSLYDNLVGAQMNCMTCHACAIYTKGKPITNQPGNYLPDTYVDLGSKDTSNFYYKYFNGALQLDFLWSIQSNLYNPNKK